MNGEDLVYDWQHNVVNEPSEWAYNWDYGECGTPKPQAVEHHATMWLVNNVDDPVPAMKAYFTRVGKELKNIKYKMIPPKEYSDEDDDDEEYDEDQEFYYKFEITDKKTNELLLRGKMLDPGKEYFTPDPNIGIYATFQSASANGMTLIQNLAESEAALANPGIIAWVPHDRIVTDIGRDYQVVSVTGVGPRRGGEDDRCRDGNLATRFTLFHEDQQVARCLLSYEDGSFDASVGPTIEMLAVKQSRRGEGLAKVLWYYVRRFVENNFIIECLNVDAPPKHIMVKATQIDNSEVEIRLEKDGTKHSMGFKEFLYDYCGFSVREQHGPGAYLFSGRRIKDEEAILYIPLLPHGTTSPLKVPKPGKAIYREEPGARMCQWCTQVSKDAKRCARCGVAFYCNVSCQRKDWKRHKLWCNKSREQVLETLIQQGNMSVDEDGSYCLHMNGPGRTFC